MILHPELLPGYFFATSLEAFFRQHPEAAEAYIKLTGEDVNAKMIEIGAAVRRGTFGTREIRQLETWHRRTRHLAATTARWN